jgi:pimeloyl-ACP methyl ester carboxylesterase
MQINAIKLHHFFSAVCLFSCSLATLTPHAAQINTQKNYQESASLLLHYTAQERLRAGLQSKTLDLNGIRWRYSEGGPTHKPTLLLLHGLAGNRDHWNRVAEYLTPYYHVIIPDLPCNGETTVPQKFDHSIPNVAAQLRQFVEKLGVQDRLNIAGHSLGGSIATVYAAEYAFDTQSLFLLNSTGIYKYASTHYTRNPQSLKDLIVYKPGDLDEVMAEMMQNPPRLPSKIKVAKERELMARAGETVQMIDQLIMLNRIYTPDSFARLTRSVEAPTLILWGKQDKIIHADAALELQALLKRAEKPVLLNNVGHVPMLEAEQQVAQYYLPFLAKTQQLKNPLLDKLIPLN